MRTDYDPKNLPTICNENIVVEGQILNFHISQSHALIRYRTESGGWANEGKWGLDELHNAIDAWRGRYNRRDKDAKIVKRGAALVIESSESKVHSGELLKQESGSRLGSAHSVRISSNLEKAAGLINHRYDILTNPSKAQGRAVIEIGIIMLAVKESVPHGELNKWREENTNVSKTWDHYCRKAAEKFIAQHGQGTASALIEGSDSNERQVEQAEQLLLQFTGGKGPSALLHNLGIKKHSAQKHDPLPEGETVEHVNAASTWREIGNRLAVVGLKDESWAHLTQLERTNLYDVIHELDKRLKKSLEN